MQEGGPKISKPEEGVANTETIETGMEVEKPLKKLDLSINPRGTRGNDLWRPSGLNLSGSCSHGKGNKRECPQCVLDAVTESDIDILDFDVGGAGTPNPVSKDLICVYSKRTAGGGHQRYEYIRKDRMQIKQFCDYLNEHKQNNISAAEYNEETRKVTVWSNKLGLWIGTNGRWKRAYEELGFDVEFKELDDLKRIEYERLPEEFQDIADKEQKVVGTERHFGNEEVIWGIPKESIFWREYKNKPEVPIEEIRRQKQEKTKKEFERRTADLEEFFEYCKILVEEYKNRGLDIRIDRDTLFTYDEMVESYKSYSYPGINFVIEGVDFYGDGSEEIPVIAYENKQDMRLGDAYRFTVKMPLKAGGLTEEILEKKLQNKILFKLVKPEYDLVRNKLKDAEKEYSAYSRSFELDNTLNLYPPSIEEGSDGLSINFNSKRYACDVEGLKNLNEDIERIINDLGVYAKRKIEEQKKLETPKPAVVEVEPVSKSIEKSSLEIEFDRAIEGKGLQFSRIIEVKDGKLVGVRNVKGDINETNSFGFETGSRTASIDGNRISVFSKNGNKMYQYLLPKNGSFLLGRNGENAYVVETEPVLRVVSRVESSNIESEIQQPATHNPFSSLKDWKRN